MFWRQLETGPAESGGSELVVAPAAASCGPADFLTFLTSLGAAIAKTIGPWIGASRQLQLAPGKTRRETRRAWIPETPCNVIAMAGGVTLFGPFPSELAETSCGSVTVGHGGASKHSQPCMLGMPVSISPADSSQRGSRMLRIANYSRSDAWGNVLVGIRGPKCFLPSNRASRIRGHWCFPQPPSSPSEASPHAHDVRSRPVSHFRR